MTKWEKLLVTVRRLKSDGRGAAEWNPRVKVEADRVLRLADMAVQRGIIMKNVRKRLGESDVITGVTLWIRARQCFGILGQSGELRPP